MFEKITQLAISPLFWSAFAAVSATVINICLYSLNKKTFKLLYEKPNVEILEAFATPPAESNPDFWKSLINLSISNPSNFENTICSFKLFSLRSFRLVKIITEKEIDIKLPATSKTNAEISLSFEDVKNIRGKQAVLCLTDLKGSKVKKSFRFMPSYDPKKIKKGFKQIKKNV